MPNILFASNSVSHFPGSVIGGDAWAFDSNRVPYAIELATFTEASSPIFAESTTDETWFHFRCASNDWWLNNNEKVCEAVDINGDRIFALHFHDRTNEGFHLYTEQDGSSYTDVRYVPWGSNQIRTFDIRVSQAPLTFTIQVYMNELLVVERAFAYNQANARKPRYFRIGGIIGNGSTYRSCYSEIIIADADTRNARLDLLRPVAAGAYGNWEGPISSLSDDDPTTGMTTVSPNQSQSTILTPYTGANNISNIVQVTTTVRGLNAPTNLQHLIRLSAVDYLTPNFSVPFSKEYQVTDWVQNPATSAPWAATDLVNVEFGFRSIA